MHVFFISRLHSPHIWFAENSEITQLFDFFFPKSCIIFEILNFFCRNLWVLLLKKSCNFFHIKTKRGMRFGKMIPIAFFSQNFTKPRANINDGVTRWWSSIEVARDSICRILLKIWKRNRGRRCVGKEYFRKFGERITHPRGWCIHKCDVFSK